MDYVSCAYWTFISYKKTEKEKNGESWIHRNLQQRQGVQKVLQVTMLIKLIVLVNIA